MADIKTTKWTRMRVKDDYKIRDEIDYDTSESRVNTALYCQSLAESERVTYEDEWLECDNFYNGQHTLMRTMEGIESNDPSKAYYDYLVLTDPFKIVESQIDPNVPEPSFYGNDFLLDAERAKQREYVVKHVLRFNNFPKISTSLQRSMRKYGNAFLKVLWNDSKNDITIKYVNIDDIFPDPAATSLQDCEFINYVYYMPERLFYRVFKDDIKKSKIDIKHIATADENTTERVSDTQQEDTNKIQVIEHWYKDDDGDISCVMIVDQKELKFIDKYWKNTKEKNKLFPFIHFYAIRDESKFWGKSELTVIKPLVMAGDKILQSSIRHFELMSNATRILEEDSIVNSEELDNSIGKNIWYRKGGTKPDILQGKVDLSSYFNNINLIQREIEDTLRNYETGRGGEPDKIRTASGQSMIRADQQTQSKIKNFDPQQSYKDLFLLIDWEGLEDYTDEKMIFIGVPSAKMQHGEVIRDGEIVQNLDETKGDIFFKFSSDKMKVKDGETSYFPSVDCEVVPSNAIEKSKTFNIQTLENLLSIFPNLNQTNYKIAIKIIEDLEMKGGQDLIKQLESMYEQPVPLPAGLEPFIQALSPEQQKMLRSNPKVALSLYASMLEQQNQGIQTIPTA